MGLALLYAAIGVALGTFAGTTLAVATLPQEASVLPHLTFAHSLSSEYKIHAIANAPGAPVILNHAVNPAASVAPAPILETAANADVDQASNANANAAPTLFIHQAPIAEKPATLSTASAAATSAAAVPATFKPVTAPAASTVFAPVIVSHPVIQTADAGKPQILTLAPIVHAAPVVHAQTVKPVPASTSDPLISAAAPTHVPAQPAPKQVVADALIAASALIGAPLAAASAQPQPPAAPATSALPPASLSAGLDGSFKPLTFYSEGDATVVSYDAPSDTITTDDGRAFVIGTSVSSSTATSWQEYRSNIHYRCDQNGSCSLVRTGVIALNAKLL